MNTIKLKIGQNSISNTVVKSKHTQIISTSGIQEAFDDPNLVDDYFLKGGYKVVSDITCRNNIPCEYRKLGMQVMVVGPDTSFKRYILKGEDPCSNDNWEEATIENTEVGVKLVEDYSTFGTNLYSQRDLNLASKQVLQNLQTQIDNIELTDEKVQITENTDFAQVGENQKIFNRNVAATVQTQGNEIFNLKGITFEMDISNQKLILLDRNSAVLTEISIAFLNDEATKLEYDGAGNLVLKNEQGTILSSLSVTSFINQVGTALQLDGHELALLDKDNNYLSTVTFEVSNILGLETVLEVFEERLFNLEGINYEWSPTNRTLTLFDRNGVQLSQVSLISLDNEGTDLRYNASTLSLELWNADNELLDSIPVSSFIGSVGTQLQLNSNQLQLKDSQGNILSTVSFSVVNILGLQTALDSKLNKGSYPGNASDLKTEIDGKLNKPTTTSNTTSYPFVVGEDGNGNSARLPAGDLGKNFFNSDLSNTTARNHTMNAGVTVNTLGNPYSITGLPNKESDTTNFDKVVRYNPTTGQFAYGQAFVYNVPSTITVNHVNAPTSPDVPSYIQAIQDRLTQLHQPGVVMQRFTNWVIKTLDNTVSTTIVENNTNIYTETAVFNANSAILTNTEVVSVHTNKILPKNADWVILFNIKIASNGVGNSNSPKTNRLMGIHNSEIGTLIIPSLYLFDSTYGYASHNLAILKNGGGSKIIASTAGTTTSNIIFEAIADSIIPAMILKVGDNILIQAQYGSTTISEIYSAQALSGDDFGFCVTARKSSLGKEAIGNVSNVRYYIFP